MIKFQCGSCGGKLGAPDEYAGKRVKCSKCGQPTRVPDESLVTAGAPAPPAQPPTPRAPAAPGPARAPAPRTAAAPPPAPATSCPKCGAAINAGAALCVHCGHSLKYGVNVQTVAKARGAAAFTGRAAIGLAIVAVAALAAGAAWAGIAVATGYELGIIAWGVGLLVGIAMAIAWPTPGMARGFSAGLAALGLIVGKLLIFQWAAPAEVRQVVASDPNMIKVMVMTEMAQNREFPPELMARIEAVPDNQDPPPDLQAQIEQAVNAKLGAMSNDQKEAMTEAAVDRILGTIPYSVRLAATFSPWDILWFLLALSSAFKLGAGLVNEE